MTSTQRDGNILGFTPAWVVAYVVPGAGEQVVYNISEYFEDSINRVDFKIDRYELDNQLTYNWDIDTNSWSPVGSSLTTFDNVTHYNGAAAANGVGYRVGDVIRILGSQFGWDNVTNDATIRVAEVDSSGGIVTAFYSGFAQLNSEGTVFNNISGINIVGTGTGARWNITVTGGHLTFFDDNDMQFVSPADQYIGTDLNRYNRYAVFQNRTILGTLPQ
jgi:hypothetical protein